MPAPPSRGRRLLYLAAYLGCGVATALIARPLLSVEPDRPDTSMFRGSPRRTPPVPMPSPGTWDPLDARRRPGQPDDCPQLGACPLLPPGVTAAAVRRDEHGRECGFITGPEEVAAFTRFWADGGWTVSEATPQVGGVRTLTLHNGSAGGFAWVFPTKQPGRASLLVTLTTQPRTEDRP